MTDFIDDGLSADFDPDVASLDAQPIAAAQPSAARRQARIELELLQAGREKIAADLSQIIQGVALKALIGALARRDPDLADELALSLRPMLAHFERLIEARPGQADVTEPLLGEIRGLVAALGAPEPAPEAAQALRRFEIIEGGLAGAPDQQ